jgi:hypothetical protein
MSLLPDLRGDVFSLLAFGENEQDAFGRRTPL